MTFAFTPSYVFDGTNHDTAHESYSSGDDIYDTHGISKVDISTSFLTLYFTSSTTMSTWRGTDRSIVLNYPSGTKSWEDTYDLTTNEEYSVNTSFNYIHYTWTDMGLSSTEDNDLADTVSSAGTGTSVLTLTLS